jgi:threonine/homoserine/homoserine lactone efflux protein
VTQFFNIFTFGLAGGMTPGPNNTLLMISGARWGFRATLPHIIGILAGFPPMVLIVGAGMGEIFSRYETVRHVMRYVCLGWILYLAYQTLRAQMPSETGVKSGRPMRLWEAAAFQWVNPKAWLMALGAPAMFTAPGQDAFTGSLLVTAGFFFAAIPSTLTWCVFGAAISRFLSTQKRMQAFNTVMAVLLVTSVLPLLF